MCDNCVAKGIMTSEEAEEQRDLFAMLLGGAKEGMTPRELIVTQAAEAFQGVLNAAGYTFALGLADDGKIGIGVSEGMPGDGMGQGRGLILADFTREDVQAMLAEGE